MSRRTVLRAAGHAAWVVPTIQIVSTAPAFAAASDQLQITAASGQWTLGVIDYMAASITVANSSPNDPTVALQVTVSFPYPYVYGPSLLNPNGPSANRNMFLSQVASGWSASAVAYAGAAAHRTGTFVFTRTTQILAGGSGHPHLPSEHLRRRQRWGGWWLSRHGFRPGEPLQDSQAAAARSTPVPNSDPGDVRGRSAWRDSSRRPGVAAAAWSIEPFLSLVGSAHAQRGSAGHVAGQASTWVPGPPRWAGLGVVAHPLHTPALRRRLGRHPVGGTDHPHRHGGRPAPDHRHGPVDLRGPQHRGFQGGRDRGRQDRDPHHGAPPDDLGAVSWWPPYRPLGTARGWGRGTSSRWAPGCCGGQCTRRPCARTTPSRPSSSAPGQRRHAAGRQHARRPQLPVHAGGPARRRPRQAAPAHPGRPRCWATAPR